MLEAYYKHYSSPLFFILYMVLTVYCINNVVSQLRSTLHVKIQILHNYYVTSLHYLTAAASCCLQQLQ